MASRVPDGERIETPLDEAAARRLTGRIRLHASSLAEHSTGTGVSFRTAVAEAIDRLVELIDQGRTGQADVALGYPSWIAYVETELSDALPRLCCSQRRDVVAQLTAKGMSARAIAPVVRSSQGTVARDLRRGADAPPEFDPYAMPFALIIVEDEPTPIKVRRQPLPSTYEYLSWTLLHSVQALECLTGDDRFPGHRRAVVQRNLPRLSRAAAVLTGLLEDLRSDGTVAS